jgi:hypothetical protein
MTTLDLTKTEVDIKPLLLAQQIYFTRTVDGLSRVIFVSADDLIAQSIVMNQSDAMDIVAWLESGMDNSVPYVIEDQHIKIVIAPSNEQSVYWLNASDTLKRWRRKLAKPRANAGTHQY